MHIIDLIYDTSCIPALEAHYPEMKIEKSWDKIHGSRASVELKDEDELAYFKYVMLHGVSEVSFRFQLWWLGEPRVAVPTVKRWLREAKEEEKENGMQRM
jgi:hypothetical protein